MKASPRRCVLDPPTCASPPPSASKGRLSECEMNPGPPVCSRRKGSRSLRHNISFMAALLLLPRAQHRLRCLLDLLKVTPRSSPRCLSQEPAELLKGPGFCFLWRLRHSGVLARGQRHLKFPAGPSHLVRWASWPAPWKKGPQLWLTSSTVTPPPLGAVDSATWELE